MRAFIPGTTRLAPLGAHLPAPSPKSAMTRKSSGLIWKSITPAPAISAEPSGRIKALVNSTVQRDRQSDVLEVGSWSKVIASGRLPAILYNHSWDNLPVGKALALEELRPGDYRLPAEHLANGWGGLLLDAQIDMSRESGRDFHKAVAGGYLTEWSVGFLSDRSKDKYRDGARHIKLVDELPEISGVILGASMATQTLSVKSAAEAAGIADDELMAMMFRLEDEVWRRVIAADEAKRLQAASAASAQPKVSPRAQVVQKIWSRVAAGV